MLTIIKPKVLKDRILKIKKKPCKSSTTIKPFDYFRDKVLLLEF